MFTLYKCKSLNKYDSGHKLAVTSLRMVQKTAILTDEFTSTSDDYALCKNKLRHPVCS